MVPNAMHFEKKVFNLLNFLKSALSQSWIFAEVMAVAMTLKKFLNDSL